ncbi:hypothetical protein PU560_15910 [Georgenia sp. 10Sc9-8]|uniref:Uncharacterized protein n=1 Tax=Georgenia halotolerans TaxID=3028317 RepID=A0ABT5U199_9MICO|nr:hypothetical protein [Georgenia halotolerans]
MDNRISRDDDPHDDLIPGPTDDTYRAGRADTDRTTATPDEAAAPHEQRGQGKASPDERVTDAGERRFDQS